MTNSTSQIQRIRHRISEGETLARLDEPRPEYVDIAPPVQYRSSRDGYNYANARRPDSGRSRLARGSYA